MLTNPLSFLHEITETYRVGLHWWGEDAWGRFGGGPAPLFFKIGEKTGVIAVALIVLLAFFDKRGVSGRFPAMILIALGLSYSLFTILAFYVGFTHFGEPTVSGLQGRYFFLSAATILGGITMLLPKTKNIPEKLNTIFLGLYFLCVMHVCIEATGIYAHLWN
ncbi:hypothetical protein Gbth_013_016 [Gluconobacter thailandicus F149-1 = NBRC 100600]|nr:hypothetical protein Gbfr_005_016 [Gluconobacter frateurii M-2]GAN92608.1 hypothetical protein Gbth_013_016 [Gluconobacter thailandicus F149-1 = NBRC 100600]GBR60920.1 hypothetical protein AA100600_2367 [Gluconobacter thailandicus F149-1 = NBRC 100600]GEL86521.1 hypothetical protein GTH01_08790 [Gluconobacter thailandicus F149-1 = NBRC 100600]